MLAFLHVIEVIQRLKRAKRNFLVYFGDLSRALDRVQFEDIIANVARFTDSLGIKLLTQIKQHNVIFVLKASLGELCFLRIQRGIVQGDARLPSCWYTMAFVFSFKSRKPSNLTTDLTVELNDFNYGRDSNELWQEVIDLSDVICADDHSAFATCNSSHEIKELFMCLFESQEQYHFLTNFAKSNVIISTNGKGAKSMRNRIGKAISVRNHGDIGVVDSSKHI